jgi:hypothetical protein
VDTTDKILLGLLLLALAAFPVAVFLYLRTAYRERGWTGVKSAAIVAVVTMAIWVGIRLWPEWEIRHILRAIRHPFAMSSVLVLALIFLAHGALKVWWETNDNH